MDKGIEHQLIEIGTQLRDKLRDEDLHSSFRLRTAISPQESSETAGGWVDIGFWKDRPKGSIWRDRFARRHRLDWGITFSSTDRAKLDQLINELPDGLKPEKQYRYSARELTNSLRRQAFPKSISKVLLREEFPNDRSFYYGMYDFGVQFDLNNAARFIGNVVNSVTPSEDHLVQDLKKVARSKTTRATEILARCGQGQYRERLFKYWHGCSVTGCRVKVALRASHITPWSKSARDRLRTENGLLLVATLDALFDRGLVSFSDSGEMLTSLSAQECKLLGLNGKRIIEPNKLTAEHKKHLRDHRRRNNFSRSHDSR